LKPDNWREITQHYIIHKNALSTIEKYGLMNGHPSHGYWMTTFSRWRRDFLHVNFQPRVLGRLSVLGKVIEEELTSIVENYMKHGIPMTNHILRLNILTLLTNHHRDDLIARMGADVLPKLRLCFGQRCCQRFYKRHHFTSRVATTKMRDEIPADL